MPALAVIAVTGVLGHAALMRGYRAADASLVMSLEFARLPFVVGLRRWLFGEELIDGWTWLGAGIIFASAVYITRREAKLRRQARKEAAKDDGKGATRRHRAPITTLHASISAALALAITRSAISRISMAMNVPSTTAVPRPAAAAAR